MRLYISESEIPSEDLKAIIDRSYSTFRAEEVTPLVHIQDHLHLLELFHGPSYSFKDCMSPQHEGKSIKPTNMSQVLCNSLEICSNTS